MKFVSIIAAVLLTGCSTTVPVTKSFPVAPEELLKKCPQLNTVPEGQNSIADLLKTVVTNYQTYYECAARNEGWNDWYSEQRRINDNIKK